MIKVFDYSRSYKGWVTYPSLAEARKDIKIRFDGYWMEDRDNCHDYFMEIYHDGEYEVWILEAGSWMDYNDDDAPYKNIYHGKREDFSYFKFTERKPRVDYLF